MLSLKPIVAAAAIIVGGLASPYSVDIQSGGLALVENSAACELAGPTCREAGCRNGTETCAVLPSGTVCLDKAEVEPVDPKPVDPIIVGVDR